MAKLRFRKTVSLPGGVKITASTKGIGTSVGVKGARLNLRQRAWKRHAEGVK